jgi:hypothetical protein
LIAAEGSCFNGGMPVVELIISASKVILHDLAFDSVLEPIQTVVFM